MGWLLSGYGRGEKIQVRDGVRGGGESGIWRWLVGVRPGWWRCWSSQGCGQGYMAVAGGAVARERTGGDMARNMAVAGVGLARDRAVEGFCG